MSDNLTRIPTAEEILAAYEQVNQGDAHGPEVELEELLDFTLLDEE